MRPPFFTSTKKSSDPTSTPTRAVLGPHSRAAAPQSALKNRKPTAHHSCHDVFVAAMPGWCWLTALWVMLLGPCLSRPVSSAPAAHPCWLLLLLSARSAGAKMRPPPCGCVCATRGEAQEALPGSRQQQQQQQQQVQQQGSKLQTPNCPAPQYGAAAYSAHMRTPQYYPEWCCLASAATSACRFEWAPVDIGAAHSTDC